MTDNRGIGDLVWACRQERDMDKKLELFNKIRKRLSYPRKLAVPSMVTDDLINSTLDKI
jgi:hypothetical protein